MDAFGVCGSLFGILFCLIQNAFFFATLIISAIRKNECHGEPRLPIWLIVLGSVGIGFNCFWIIYLIVCHLCSYNKSTKAISIPLVFLLIFLLIWSITGLVWHGKLEDASGCDALVRNFVKVTGIVMTNFFGILICCGCCVLIQSSDSDSSSDTTTSVRNTGKWVLVWVSE
ncbi:hypothetical protein I4U23_004990 [Adineta vaga]|nr:hypothetical protein I4U23_004990 [Adineta vaga]